MAVFARTEAGASGINADSYYVSADRKVYAVCDGASGAYDKVAAAHLCIDAVNQLEYSSSGLSAVDYITCCVNTANKNLMEKSQADNKLSYGTMTMAVIDKEVLTVGAVGDTPAFLIREHSIVKAIKPRKRYANLIEFDVLTEEEIEKAISSIPNVMWSMFDNFLPMIIPDIAIEQYSIDNDDIFFICTDGICDWVKRDEFVEILRGESKLEDGCNTIFSKVKTSCREDWLDDRTIILVGL